MNEDDAELIKSHERDVPAGALTDDQLLDKYADQNDLPPFGCDYGEPGRNGQAMASMTRVAREAADGREPHVDSAVDNALIFDQGQTRTPSDDDIVANEISSAVLSITDLQTREPFAIFIRPVQTRDKPKVFWIGPAVDERVAAMTGLPIGLGMMPVTDELGAPIMQTTAKPRMDPMTGQPAIDAAGAPALDLVVEPVMRPIDPEVDELQPMDEVTAWQVRKLAAVGAFPSEWLVAVDDRLVADVYQNVFDVFWKEASVDDFVKENLLCTNVFGYQTGYYGWDPDAKQHIVRPLSIKQVYLDPAQPDLNLASYFGYDVEMDVDRAKAEYPQLASVIEARAKEGYPQRVDSTTEFGIGSDRHFYRRTVTFRVFFYRNQRVPMTPAEARAKGLITSHVNPVTQQLEHYLTESEDVDATGAARTESADAAQDAAGAGAGGGDEAAAAPGQPVRGTGRGGAGAIGGAESEGAPSTASWPHTLGIRQIATLAQTQTVVQDIRCEHWNIPGLLNKCVPIPGQPYARGIPYKLKGLQLADIRFLNAIVKYAETFSNPGSIMPQSVAAALKEGLKRTHVDPTEPIVVPDHIYEKWGDKSMIWFQPPPIPPAVPMAMQMLHDRFQSTSGHPEVMSGKAPSPSSSGRMVEALQAGAAGQFGFQASWTARMVEWLANLMHYSHLWRLSIDDIAQIYSRLPRQILKMTIERAQRNRWDINVDANSGTSGQTAKKLQRALAFFTARSNTGEPVLPLRMVREAANIDDEEASLVYRNEMQNAMPTPPIVPAGGPAPAVERPPSDGPPPSE